MAKAASSRSATGATRTVALLLSSTQQMPASACSSADVNTAASSRYVTVHTANCKLQLPRGNSFAARQRSNDAAGLSLSDPNRPLSERQKGRHLLRQYHVPVVSGHKQSSGLKDASRHPGQHSYITRPANKSVGARLLTAIAGQPYLDHSALHRREFRAAERGGRAVSQ